MVTFFHVIETRQQADSVAASVKRWGTAGNVTPNMPSPSSKPCRTWHHQDLVVNKQIPCQRVLSSGDCAGKSTPPMLENALPLGSTVLPNPTIKFYPHLIIAFDRPPESPSPQTILLLGRFVSPYHTTRNHQILSDGFQHSQERV